MSERYINYRKFVKCLVPNMTSESPTLKVYEYE